MSKDTSGEVLIGKRLGVFEDMRLRPAKWYGANFDPGGLDHVSVEQLLKLTAGNSITQARKWIGAWEGVIPIHIWIVSNVVPTLNDPVLPGRFIKLAFEQSFFGREDTSLKGKLCRELPGIAQRAIAAYRAAKGRGWLIQPKAGLALKAEVEANADPFMAFMNECLVVDGNASVACGAVWVKWQFWCQSNGQGALLKSISDPSKLTKRLKKVQGLSGLQTTSNHPRNYLGLRLKRSKE
jgi:putative DNA primase/helicase